MSLRYALIRCQIATADSYAIIFAAMPRAAMAHASVAGLIAAARPPLIIGSAGLRFHVLSRAATCFLHSER